MTSTQMQPANNASRRVFIALDVDSESKAIEIGRELTQFGVGFKIGLQLFTLGGPTLVSKIVDLGSPVFLDLKFHDIPNTVASAAAEAAKLGVSIFNVHASGGAEMMLRTAEAVDNVSARSNIERPKVIAVTVLTSADSVTLKGIGVESEVEPQVVRLARLAAESGMDGVVASARESKLIRSEIGDRDFLIVTPGIRPASAKDRATIDDQKRVTTPGEAILAGATHLVIGRPVIAAADRAHALKQILNEIETALNTNASQQS
jgi:orotidine-5'-phosphate decarboxylase